MEDRPRAERFGERADQLLEAHAGGWRAAPRAGRVPSHPARGPPIDRRGVTAETGLFQAQFPALDPGQVTAWETFFRATLAGGVTPFAWRDPVTGLAWLWKVAPQAGSPAWSLAARGARLCDLALGLIRMPGPPWWQPHVTGTAPLRLPRVVADYAAGVFGIDLSRVPAADVAAVAGTFDLLVTDDLGATVLVPAEVVTAGDIPATAPSGIDRILAFDPV